MKFKTAILAGIIAGATFGVGCAPTIDVEYPVFPKTKEGRQLQKFVGTLKSVGLIIEKPEKSLWDQIFGGSSFVDMIPHKVFEAFDKENYYRLVDVEKRKQLLKEQAFSESGLTQNSRQIGKLLSADMLLFVKFEKPVTECGIEAKVDGLACSAAMVSAASGGSGGSGCQAKPTGVRLLEVPLNASLIKTDTGEVMRATALGKDITAKHFGAVGSRSCPPILDAFDDGLNKSVNYVKDRLSPRVKTAEIKIVVKDKDPVVADLLEEGLEEIRGDTPSFEKAAANWKKALQKSPESEGANANMGSYYFSTGDFEQAVKYYEKAMSAKGSDKNYWREMRKRVEAVMAVDAGK
ncbi:MAG: lipoprotein LipL41 [Spirochaetia bacterium]|nr:lipoprotein LipL41 [Spirochaetia bacterium]